MSQYQLHYSGTIIIEHLSLLDKDRQPYPAQRQIPIDPTNWAYALYQQWLLIPGNTPDPADPAPPPDPFAQSDADALAAFRLGWLLGQARLQGTGPNSIQTQMDGIQGDTINTLVKAATHIQTLSQAVEDLSRQVFILKRAVAIQAQVPDR